MGLRILQAILWSSALLNMVWLLAALGAGLGLYAIVFYVCRKLAARTPAKWDETVWERLAAPSRLLFPLLMVKLSESQLAFRPKAMELFSHCLSLLFLGAISFLLFRGIRVLSAILQSRYDPAAADNITARKVYTQIGVLEKTLLFLLFAATAAFMLMTFPGVKQVGISILTSAGIAGIVIGLAAQKSIGTLLAGLQIAITQPIRLDDVVIVEGQWGRIEEITLTYVVVCVWDLRRLIVPISYFIEKPFENWTRTSARILGSVFLYLDYSAPIEPLRAEAARFVSQSPLWDGKVCGLQVTDCKDRAIELRILVSTANASAGWDLRCALREHMLTLIQNEYPQALPRLRAEMRGQDGPETSMGDQGGRNGSVPSAAA